MATELDHVRHGALVAPRRPAGIAWPEETVPDSRQTSPQIETLKRPEPRPSAQQAASAVTQRQPNLALVGLQLLLGYEWLTSGLDKLLYATFPQALGPLLTSTLRAGTIPAPFAELFRALVLPHSATFGLLVEWGETLAGLGLITAALAALIAPWAGRRLGAPAARWVAHGQRIIAGLAVAAAAGAGLMGLSFYILDGLPTPWPMPSIAFGGVLDVGLLLALGSVILVIASAGEWLRHRTQS